MDVRQLFAVARRWIRLLVLGFVAGAVIGFGLASVMPKMYSSTTTLLVGQPFTATTGILAANQLQAQTYTQLAILRPMLEKVIAAVGLQESPDDLAKQVRVQASTTINVLSITATNQQPDVAAAVADQMAAQLIALATTASVVAGSTTAPGAPTLVVVEPAIAASTPSSPKVLLLTLMGTFGGLLVAAAISAVVMQGERSIRRFQASADASSLSYQVTVAAGPRVEIHDAGLNPDRAGRG
jgi:succinoglycan biosynthesis transport protein ExoP